VHNKNGQRVRSIGLPMAMAKHFDSRRHFDQALLGCRHVKTSLDQETGKCLHVSAAQPAPWRELTRLFVRLRNNHALILNRDGGFS
jgi:hypothetical protein